MKIIAYTYEADVHCIQCTNKRFQLLDAPKDSAERRIDRNRIITNTRDSEGNELHPIFSTDENPSTHCGTCHKTL